MLDNIVQIGEMRARFLMPGDIIERHSRIYVVSATPIVASLGRPGHIVVVCANEEGGYEPLSMHAELFVPKFDAVNDAEWSAVVARFDAPSAL